MALMTGPKFDKILGAGFQVFIPAVSFCDQQCGSYLNLIAAAALVVTAVAYKVAARRATYGRDIVTTADIACVPVTTRNNGARDLM